MYILVDFENASLQNVMYFSNFTFQDIKRIIIVLVKIPRFGTPFYFCRVYLNIFNSKIVMMIFYAFDMCVQFYLPLGLF